MYETGTPGPAQRHRRLQRLSTTSPPAPNTSTASTAWTKRSSAGCATCATRSSATGRPPAHGQGPDRSAPATRSPPKSRRWPAPAPPLQSRQSALVAARADRVAALRADPRTRRRARRLGRRDPGQDRRAAGGNRLGAAAGRADPGRQRQRPDLAGRRPGRLRLRLAHDQRQLRVPPGDRHRRARRDADPRRRRRHRDLHRARGESGGYGNYTCIDHGGGLSTCYAHQSSFAVSAGQSVSQGQIIGYSGCTGYCFGPHLHFEVRINGEVTDPMGYL